MVTNCQNLGLFLVVIFSLLGKLRTLNFRQLKNKLITGDLIYRLLSEIQSTTYLLAIYVLHKMTDFMRNKKDAMPIKKTQFGFFSLLFGVFKYLLSCRARDFFSCRAKATTAVCTGVQCSSLL